MGLGMIVQQGEWSLKVSHTEPPLVSYYLGRSLLGSTVFCS